MTPGRGDRLGTVLGGQKDRLFKTGHIFFSRKRKHKERVITNRRRVAFDQGGLNQTACTKGPGMLCGISQALNKCLYQVKETKRLDDLRTAFMKKRKAPKGVGAQ